MNDNKSSIEGKYRLDGADPIKESELRYERPSPHSTNELYRMTDEGRRAYERGHDASTAQGLGDGLAHYVKAKADRRGSGVDRAVEEWELSKHGPVAYTDAHPRRGSSFEEKQAGMDRNNPSQPKRDESTKDAFNRAAENRRNAENAARQAQEQRATQERQARESQIKTKAAAEKLESERAKAAPQHNMPAPGGAAQVNKNAQNELEQKIKQQRDALQKSSTRSRNDWNRSR